MLFRSLGKGREGRLNRNPRHFGAADCLSSPQVCQASGVFSPANATAGTAHVSEPPSPRTARGAEAPRAGKRSFFERLVEFVLPGPDSRDELLQTLADAEQRELIEPESRAMLEGVLRMADMRAGDVMVAAPRVDLLDIDAHYEDILDAVIRTAH